MSFNRIAENRIREAMAEGKFDKLAGAGQPLDLDEYFRTPEDVRMAYSILKSAHCVPQEIELLHEVRRLEQAVAAAGADGARAALQRELSTARTKLEIMLERGRRSSRGRS